MRQYTSISQVPVFVTLLAACAPASRTVPPVISMPPIGVLQTDIERNYLRLSSGSYRYRFTETADVRSQNPMDTTPGVVKTRGLLQVVVSPRSDSSFDVVVSVDSISIEHEGLIPPPSAAIIVRLDSVLHTVFTPTGSFTKVLLPDSLCAYSQFIITARNLLLPELPNNLEVPSNQLHRDTTQLNGCRAGIRVQVSAQRQLQDLRTSPPEFRLEQETDIRGHGTFHRDTVAIVGSISTTGKVSFQHGNRLPSQVQTRSDGTITVQLGTIQTLFRQTSTQQIELNPLEPPQ